MPNPPPPQTIIHDKLEIFTPADLKELVAAYYDATQHNSYTLVFHTQTYWIFTAVRAIQNYQQRNRPVPQEWRQEISDLLNHVLSDFIVPSKYPTDRPYSHWTNAELLNFIPPTQSPPGTTTPSLAEQIDIITRHNQIKTAHLMANLRTTLQTAGINKALVEDFLFKNQDLINRQIHIQSALMRPHEPAAELARRIFDGLKTSSAANHSILSSVDDKVLFDLATTLVTNHQEELAQTTLRTTPPKNTQAVLVRVLSNSQSDPQRLMADTQRLLTILDSAIISGQAPTNQRSLVKLIADKQSGLSKEIVRAITHNPNLQNRLLAHTIQSIHELPNRIKSLARDNLNQVLAHHLDPNSAQPELSLSHASAITNAVLNHTSPLDRTALEQILTHQAGLDPGLATRIATDPSTLQQINSTLALHGSGSQSAIEATKYLLSPTISPNSEAIYHTEPDQILNVLATQPQILFAEVENPFITPAPPNIKFNRISRLQNISQALTGTRPPFFTGLAKFFRHPWASLKDLLGIGSAAARPPSFPLGRGVLQFLRHPLGSLQRLLGLGGQPPGVRRVPFHIPAGLLTGLGRFGRGLFDGLRDLFGNALKAAKPLAKDLGKLFSGLLVGLPHVGTAIALTMAIAVLISLAMGAYLQVFQNLPRDAAQIQSIGGKSGGGPIAENPYVGLIKTASPAQLDKPTGNITYTYTVTAKQGPLTNVSLTSDNEKTTIYQKSGTRELTLVAPTPPASIDSTWTSDSFTLPLDSSMNDAVITNSIIITATAPNNSNQTAETGATVIIGTPPTGCFSPKPASSYRGSSIVATDWPPAIASLEYAAAAQIIGTFSEPQAKVLCGPNMDESINLYLASQGTSVHCGGWYLGGGNIAIDFTGGTVCGARNAAYTLAHESGHAYDERTGISGAAFRDAHLVSWTGSGCEGNIYPIDVKNWSEALCYTENFAEGFSRCILHMTMPSGNWCPWYAKNVFGR